MGGTRSSADSWSSYSSSTATKSSTFKTAYTNTGGVKDAYDPKKIKVRESVKSAANPEPTPIIFAFDCTGSMQDLALSGVKNIGTLMAETYDRVPVTDPAIMAMFVDDIITAPGNALQVTQFESDKVIIDQLKDLYFVGRGGGNNNESYNLPLYFAIHKCVCDAFDEGRKGFLFIMGDDGPPPPLTAKEIETEFGPDSVTSGDMSMKGLIDQASENWHVFFIYPRHEAAGAASYHGNIPARWRELLGERFLVLEDIDKLAEVLVATMQVIQGADKHAVAASFTDPGTSLVVSKAVAGLVPATSTPGGGIVRL